MTRPPETEDLWHLQEAVWDARTRDELRVAADKLVFHLGEIERPRNLTAFGTVTRDYDTGEAPVAVQLPSGHWLTLDPEQPPIYAAEHLHTGQRVAWATWLAGNAVVGAE